MLVADGDDLRVIGVAGDVEGRLTNDWPGRPLAELIGDECMKRVSKAREKSVVVLGALDGCLSASTRSLIVRVAAWSSSSNRWKPTRR
jgi:hypothetical protein